MLVKIWNDHNETYKEEFNNELISIPPGEFHEMQRGAAVKFLSSFKPFKRDGVGEELGIKKLRMEIDPVLRAKELKQPIPSCMKCGKEFANELMLENHLVQMHNGQQLKSEDEDNEKKPNVQRGGRKPRK